jgi:hypothetical protein
LARSATEEPPYFCTIIATIQYYLARLGRAKFRRPNEDEQTGARGDWEERE